MRLHDSGRAVLTALANRLEANTHEVANDAVGGRQGIAAKHLRALVANGLAVKVQDGVKGHKNQPARWKVTPEGLDYLVEHAETQPAPAPRSSGPRLIPRQKTQATLQIFADGHPHSSTELQAVGGAKASLLTLRNKGWLKSVRRGRGVGGFSIYQITPAGKAALNGDQAAPGETQPKQRTPAQMGRKVGRSVAQATADDDILDDVIEVLNAAMMVDELKPKARRVFRYMGSRGLLG